MKPGRVIKWVGSKVSLAPQIIEHFNSPIEWYCEPFFGSGAVYFELAMRHALSRTRLTLGDANKELMEMWAKVATDPTEFANRFARDMEILSSPEEKKAAYLVNRKQWNEGWRNPWKLLFLNRCCFNGLWRENSKGELNTPAGTCKWDIAKVIEAIHEHHQLFSHVSLAPDLTDIVGGSWVSTVNLALARARDSGYAYRITFYLDPPYLYHSKASFSDYAKGGFGLAHHRDLARAGIELAEMGHHVVISGAANDATRGVYQGYDQFPASCSERVSCQGETRGRRQELVMRPRPGFEPKFPPTFALI